MIPVKSTGQENNNSTKNCAINSHEKTCQANIWPMHSLEIPVFNEKIKSIYLYMVNVTILKQKPKTYLIFKKGDNNQWDVIFA